MAGDGATTRSEGWLGLSTLGAMRGQRYEPPPRSRGQLRIGSTLLDERFVIEQVLGHGGEGTVYAAYDTQRGQRVALKILHFAHGETSTLVKREFRFLSNLIHPRLVHLHELFVTGELSFFTMALVEGPPFSEAARDRVRLRKFLVDLCEGLEFLHANGRVHRDVKPTNIVISRGEELVLVDFGVSIELGKHAGDDTGPIGTPRYMAPEVVLGRDASPKSDAFSVGVLLFEALTGELPFASATDALLHPARAPSEIDPEIDPEFDRICARLLAPTPDERASLTEILEILTERSSSPSLPNSSHRIRATSRFVGRDRELGRLGAAYYQVQTGRDPIVALVAGKSGFGKTAFLEEFAQFADGVVLFGQCSEHELVPHKGLDGVLEGLAAHLATLDEERILELIPNHDAQRLVPLFPELRSVSLLNELVPNVETSEVARSLRLEAYDALVRILERLAEREPVTIVVDDLQWGDPDTARLLSEVFGRDSSPACLVILAFREEDEFTSACLHGLFAGTAPLIDRVRTLRIDLAPLEDREAARLLRSHLTQVTLTESTVEALIAECAGTPLLLNELGLHAASLELRELPEDYSLRSVVAARKARLAAPFARAFSFLAATRHAKTSFLAKLVGCSPDELVVKLESARLARSLDGGKSLRVLHDRIREIEIDTLGERAAELHEAIAEALIQEHGEPAIIARHFMAAGLRTKASLWAERAAHLAGRSLALTSAIELFRLALEGEAAGTPRHRELTVELAYALADAGYGSEAAPLFAELARGAASDVAIPFRTRAAAQFLSSGRVEEGWRELERVNEDAGLDLPKSPRDAIVEVAKNRAKIWWARMRGGSRTTDRPLPVELERKLLACRAGWSVSYVSLAHGAALSARYLKYALDAGDPEHLGLAYGLEGLYRATDGISEEPIYLEFKRLAERHLGRENSSYGRGFLGYVDGQGSYLFGNLAESLVGYERAEPEFVRNCCDVAWELSATRIFWGSALLILGRHRELDRRLKVWLVDAEERGDEYALTALLMHSARRVGLRDGDYRLALEQLDEATNRWKSPFVSVHRAMGAFARIALFTSVDIDAADAAVKQLDAEMASSLMNRTQIVRVSCDQMRGLVLCHKLRTAKGSDRKPLLSALSRCVRRLRVEQTTMATLYAEQLVGCVEYYEGKHEASFERLSRTAHHYREIGMTIYASSIVVRLAEAGLLPHDHPAVLQATREFALADVLFRDETIGHYVPPLA